MEQVFVDSTNDSVEESHDENQINAIMKTLTDDAEDAEESILPDNGDVQNDSDEGDKNAETNEYAGHNGGTEDLGVVEYLEEETEKELTEEPEVEYLEEEVEDNPKNAQLEGDESALDTGNKKSPRTKGEKKEASLLNGDVVDKITGNEEYEVEQIVDRKLNKTGRITHYKVRWKGYQAEDDTWEKVKNLNCDDLIQGYNDLNPIPPPPPIEEAATDSKVYEVAQILGVRRRTGEVTHYKVRWKGFSKSSDTWENVTDLNCPDLIKQFEKNKSNNEEAGPSKETKVTPTRPLSKRIPTKSNKSSSAKRQLPKKKLQNTPQTVGRGRPKRSPRTAAENKNTSKASLKRAASTENKFVNKKRKFESDSESDDEYEVSEILEVNYKKNGSRKFLVRWKGYGASEDSWEPDDNLNCKDLIENFVAIVDKVNHQNKGNTSKKEDTKTPKKVETVTQKKVSSVKTVKKGKSLKKKKGNKNINEKPVEETRMLRNSRR